MEKQDYLKAVHVVAVTPISCVSFVCQHWYLAFSSKTRPVSDPKVPSNAPASDPKVLSVAPAMGPEPFKFLGTSISKLSAMWPEESPSGKEKRAHK